jgi:hypothetical protein
LLAALLLGPGAAGGREPRAENWKEFSHSLKGLPEDTRDVVRAWPDPQKAVRFETDGLRISLPAGYPGERQTGVAAGFALKGDFEITVRYEILREPDPGDDGPPGSRLTLGVDLDIPGWCAANFSRKVGSKLGPRLVAWMAAREDLKRERQVRLFVAEGREGRLRLVRKGDVLSYLAAGPGDKEFRRLQEYRFGGEAVREVRLSATTGGEKAALDVRFTDLSIRADGLTRRLPAAPPDTAPGPAPPPPPAQSPVRKMLSEHIHFPLHAVLENQPLLDLFGPDVESLAKPDAQGLRFILPADRPNTNVVGVESELRLRGDFEVTLGYELLAVPDPAPELGAGVQLVLTFDSRIPTRAIVTRSQKPARPVFGANLVTTGPNGDQWRGLNVPAREPRGKLRLARAGSMLVYSAADGDADFRPILSMDAAPDDVALLRAQCLTGWKPFSLDARLIDLDVRAEQIPNKGAPGEKPAPAGARPPEGRGWLAAGLIIGLGVVSSLAAGVWLLARRGRGQAPARAAAGDGAAKPEGAPPAASFACPGCGRKLRAASALAGKKVKCPACGRGVVVPATGAGDPGPASP